MKKKFSNYLSSTGIDKRASDFIQGFAGNTTSLFDGLKKNFKESTGLIPKDNFNSFINNYFNDNFSSLKNGEKFNYNYDIGKIFENNIKDVNNSLKKKIKDANSFIEKFNFQDALDKDVIEELKKN